MPRLIHLLLVLLLASPAIAQSIPSDAASTLLAAQEAFTQGRAALETQPSAARQLFARSSLLFENLITTHDIQNADLHYNHANALALSGQPGRAVAAYLRAQRLRPHDRDIAAGLSAVRAQTSTLVTNSTSVRVTQVLTFWRGIISRNILLWGAILGWLVLWSADLCVPGVEFAYSYAPGRMVAGDLFDVVALEGNRVGMFLGDVMGKGAGAAVAMTAMQTWLCAGLPRCDELSKFVSDASSFCYNTFESAKFVTLWFGLVDLEARRLEFVDAGHGFCILIPAGRTPLVVTTKGGPPLGLMPDCVYPSDTMHLGKGDRVVLFSDGVVEQFDAAHTEQFGMKRALSLLETSDSPQEDVRVLEEAVRAHADAEELTDDLTIASISFS